jgi:hypothetical protein
MPDITPTDLESSGLRAIGRELAAGFKDGLNGIYGALSLSRSEPEMKDPEGEAAKKKDEPEAEEAPAKADADAEGKAESDKTEAGYDDLDKALDTEGAIDVTDLVNRVNDGLQDFAKSMQALTAMQASLGAEIAGVRADLEATRAENAALKTMIGASHLALAKLSESIVDPLMKSITERPSGVSAGMAATSPGAAAARLGNNDAPALVAYSDEDLAKAVEAGAIDANASITYKFRKVFSTDPSVDAAIRRTLNATLTKSPTA